MNINKNMTCECKKIKINIYEFTKFGNTWEAEKLGFFAEITPKSDFLR